ncbi:hypothetical protein [Sulfuriroseicoccus oceanibius]|uniref:DUF4034 domain-containing protein n=1 Tax=Sulfuriroseicoccus oceanibius TaxID=2707525 RepID=A0A6B3L8P5_9BACT|nr:hypothetical protein [Sulfuriroseicoccus oceanibius]QQL45758.1 hypothetical protein G3M56_004000 [Sulfuriroseicoccus oceanibius]
MMRGKKVLVMLGILLVFGLVRWPVESALTRDLRAGGVLPEPLDVTMREQLSQNSYVAAFGGFRSVIASIRDLQAYVAWEDRDWGKVERDYEVITALQPRVGSYWETASWHMAYNAAGYYREDWDEEGVTDELRRERWQRYIDRGYEFLKDGMRYNPERWRLPMLAGMLFSDRFKKIDHEKAAHYFEMAAAREGCPEYIRRRVAYELSYVKSRRDDAYQLLQALYDESPQHHLPMLLGSLLDLQLELGVDPDRMVRLTEFGTTDEEIAQQLSDYRLYRKSMGGGVGHRMGQLIDALTASEAQTENRAE